MDFTGKTALVTGAAVGIGRATALRLAEQGASLVISDINGDGLAQVKDELRQYTDDVLALECNVSDEARVREVTKEALARFGKIDILVNNAALWRDVVPFLESSTELWQKYFNINVMGVMYFTRELLGQMMKNGYGRIINVASVAAVYGNANMAHYSATKGAVISMTRALAKEAAESGVLINSVSPGTVSPADQADMDYTQESDMSYLGRTGSDRENADLICFLASGENGYISGQNIQIDGCRKRQ